jgi:hypothetical protein
MEACEPASAFTVPPDWLAAPALLVFVTEQTELVET